MKSVDTLVIGSGIAGLFTALQASAFGSVGLVTKSALQESNTRYAQGGIAAVLFDDDEVASHIDDTLAAGAGLCDPAAVEVLCTEGPDRVRELIALGVAFDRDEHGWSRGLEGAHSKARVLHAGGDATGAHIEAALAAAVRNKTNISVQEHFTLTDLTVTGGCVTGAKFDGDLSIEASRVVLATGGAGQVYRHTTNPEVATGDGVAAAFRAGAVIRDAEMYQFHPTALALGGEPFLVSEAVRGEGAVLRNADGKAFMSAYSQADLAPRDVVARAIAYEMTLQDGAPITLDTTALGANFLVRRFPSIDRQCRMRGVDWSRQPVPVTPAAHYWMGGVATDLYGRTSVEGLYAVGEVANTGVHGANRLASNSLLEGIVFGFRAARALAVSTEPHPTFDPQVLNVPALSTTTCSTDEIRNLMWDRAGLIRDAHDLQVALKQLNAWTASDTKTTSLLTTARLIVASALKRQESRGAHFRNDFRETLASPSPSIEWVQS